MTDPTPNSAALNRLRAVRHLALDLDGTLYCGSRLFDWTRPFLDRLAELGVGRTFLTNNSSRSRRDYVTKLHGLGIEAEVDDVFPSTLSAVDHIRATYPSVGRVFVLGTPSLQEELSGEGFEVVDDDPDAVVVGFDTTLVYERLCRAAWFVSQGLPFIATHPDRTCPTDQPTVLVDCGAICAAIALATGREPEVLGKPHRSMLSGILARHGLAPHELAMVGDRLYTDMAMARRAATVGVLVLSGEATVEGLADSDESPDVVVEHVGRLGEMLS